MYMQANNPSHTQAHARTHAHTQTQTDTHTHTHSHTHTRTHAHTRHRSRKQTQTRTRTHTHARTQIQTDTHTHLYEALADNALRQAVHIGPFHTGLHSALDRAVGLKSYVVNGALLVREFSIGGKGVCDEIKNDSVKHTLLGVSW